MIASNGLTWHNNRRFALRQLRDLGMGKSKLVGAVHTQAEMLIEEFKKHSGKPTKIPHAINVAVVNMIWQMVASKSMAQYESLRMALSTYAADKN